MNDYIRYCNLRYMRVCLLFLGPGHLLHEGLGEQTTVNGRTAAESCLAAPGSKGSPPDAGQV